MVSVKHIKVVIKLTIEVFNVKKSVTFPFLLSNVNSIYLYKRSPFVFNTYIFCIV